MAAGDVQIAGSKTVNDWLAFKPGLEPGGVANLWTVAAKDYFRERLNRRYLGPIKILQDHDSFAGEGFSIVAIQCSIVEFLESTVQGINYRYLRRGDTLGQYEYHDSRDLFVNFLCQRLPFSIHFNDPLGQDFYTGVRCGLLHEARTKNGWTIWGDERTGAIVKTTGTSKVVYRNNFQKALLAFVDWYEKTLPLDSALQEAFIRKFDSLCQ